VQTPERTSAAAFPHYSQGEVLADSAAFQWPGLFARHARFPRVVDRCLVPATAEPLITCVTGGIGEMQEREIGESWVTRPLQRGAIFITRSRVPYEVRWSSPTGKELNVMIIHLAVDRYREALESACPGKADQVEVIDFFGRDEAIAHLCYSCAEMLSTQVPGQSKRVAALTELFAAHLVEKYTNAVSEKPNFSGGLPIRQLRKVEDYVGAHLCETISGETLAKLTELSPFHFSRVFKQTTGMTPLQFVTRQRITRAQQFIRETSRSLIEVALEVGYTSPSHFAQVFRQVVGVTPTQFRKDL
jgi:AraC family transcriptional regulator